MVGQQLWTCGLCHPPATLLPIEWKHEATDTTPVTQIIPHRGAEKMDNPPLKDGEWVFLRGRVVGCIEQDDGQVVAMVEAKKVDGKPSDINGWAVFYWPVDSVMRPEMVKKEMERGHDPA